MRDVLEKRDSMMLSEPSLPRGILDPIGASRHMRIRRYAPSAPFRPFIDHHWIAEWRLPDSAAVPQRAIPSPHAHLLVSPGQTALIGVVRGVEERVLRGQGQAFGIRLRVGGLRPFLGQPVASLTGRTVSPALLTGCEAAVLESRILTKDGHQTMIEAAEMLLRPSLPQVDPNVDLVCSVVAEIRRAGGRARAETLAKGFGIGLRAMQRLFHDYVGVSPKWVIQRYRLQDAAYLLSSGTGAHLAQLADELGYFDQAHLTRDFRRIFGVSPALYLRMQGALGD